jgi:hypothetical protein
VHLFPFFGITQLTFRADAFPEIERRRRLAMLWRKSQKTKTKCQTNFNSQRPKIVNAEFEN